MRSLIGTCLILFGVEFFFSEMELPSRKSALDNTEEDNEADSADDSEEDENGARLYNGQQGPLRELGGDGSAGGSGGVGGGGGGGTGPGAGGGTLAALIVVVALRRHLHL